MPRLFALALLSAAALTFAQAPPAPQPPATIQTRTDLVVEDVVVTDRAGNPVHGLTRSDLLLSEGGVPQQLRTFDEHIAQPPAPPPPPLNLPAGVFTNYAPAPLTPALNVLLFDTLNTPLEAQSYARQQLLHYIRTAPSGQRLAIFGLTSRLILLQGFTADPAILRAAIEGKSIRPSLLLNNNAAASESLSGTLTDLAGSAGTQGAEIAEAAANVRQFEADNSVIQLGIRTRYTLDALATLGRYLGAFPGRKNILWFSGSFPINVFPDATLNDPLRSTADFSSSIRDTASVLARAQVAVYPIDSRGLFSDPIYSAANDGRSLISPGAATAESLRFSSETAAENTTMLAMAEATGGRAFINTNDLSGAVTRAIRNGSNFYTLTYSPANHRFDGAFRKLELRLVGARASEGLTLSYRRGYYAIDPEARPRRLLSRPTPPGAPSTASPTSNLPTPALHAAMLRGAPEATGIVFKVAVLPASPPSAAPELTVAPSNQPDPQLAKAPFRSYTVDFAAFPSQLLTRGSNGNYTGSIRFITIAYNAEGSAVNLVDQTTGIDIPGDAYALAQRAGVRYHQLISVPAKGDFFLRIGINDLAGDRIGSIEVPVVAIKNLPPAPASGPSTTP